MTQIHNTLDIRNASDSDLEAFLYTPCTTEEMRSLRSKCLKEYVYRIALCAMMDSSIQKDIGDYFSNPIL
jgi:hypothetical protein